MNKPYDKDAAAQATSIRVYNDVTVKAKAGSSISVTVQQTVAGKIAPESTPAVHFSVVGPHALLQPPDVVGCYPADGSTTSPEEFLAHIALSRRSLPWERDGVIDENGKATPWLALLLFAESELETTGDDAVRTMLLSGLKTEDLKSYTALHAAYPDDSTQLDIIGVKKSALAQALPRKLELSLLCHIQQLVIDGAAPAADDPDAPDPMWALDADCQVAIVVGNRLPDAGDGSAPPEKHYACLVSIEKRDDLPWPTATRTAYQYPTRRALVEGTTRATSGLASEISAAAGQVAKAAIPPVVNPANSGLKSNLPQIGQIGQVGQIGQIDQVGSAANILGIHPAEQIFHLAVLRHWTFTPSTGGDFEQVVQAIRYSPNGGVLQFGVLPRHLSVAGGLDKLTTDGSLSLVHQQGGNVTYRGPLTPNTPPARSPGYALRAEPQELVGANPDESYASAFELGRMLTLADDGLLSDLQDVRLQLVLPQIAPVYAVDKVPTVLAKRDWGVDPPDWGDISALPQEAADPGGVQSLTSQINQITAGLDPAAQQNPGGVVGIGGIAGIGALVDIENVAAGALDAQFQQVITAQRP